MSRVAYTWEDWWGSPAAIVKAPHPESLEQTHELRPGPQVKAAVAAVTARLPGSPVTFGDVRYAPNPRGGRGIRERRLVELEGWAVDVSLLEWAEKVASVERWETVTLPSRGDVVFLAGVKLDRHLVAVIGARSSA
jgi:hypothetical protein